MSKKNLQKKNEFDCGVNAKIFCSYFLHIMTRLYLQVQMKSIKDFKCGSIIHNVDIKKGKNFHFLVRYPSRRVLPYTSTMTNIFSPSIYTRFQICFRASNILRHGLFSCLLLSYSQDLCQLSQSQIRYQPSVSWMEGNQGLSYNVL